MLRGTRSIYVDYVDYDEIAHHAGMLRPESLEAVEAVDGVLRQLELVATATPRRYRFVVLSDHGQAQGTPFADRYGEDLATLVARLARTDVASSDDDVEGWGRTRALVESWPPTAASAAGACRAHRRPWTSGTATNPMRSKRRPSARTAGPLRRRPPRPQPPETRPSTCSAPAISGSSTSAGSRNGSPAARSTSAIPGSWTAWPATPVSASSSSSTTTARSPWAPGDGTGSTTATSRARTRCCRSGRTRPPS